MSAAHRESTPAPASEDAGVPRVPGWPGRLGAPQLEELRERRVGARAGGRRASDRRPHSDGGLVQERRRIAADLHDLVMQDVSFALARTRAIAG
ncbi:MAG: hypothetical protein ACYDC2_05085, partial [Solirubrobacteraceae bacterium]